MKRSFNFGLEMGLAWTELALRGEAGWLSFVYLSRLSDNTPVFRGQPGITIIIKETLGERLSRKYVGPKEYFSGKQEAERM